MFILRLELDGKKSSRLLVKTLPKSISVVSLYGVTSKAGNADMVYCRWLRALFLVRIEWADLLFFNHVLCSVVVWRGHFRVQNHNSASMNPILV